MGATISGPFGQISLDTDVLTLGRLSDNKVVINDSKASSHHAELRQEGQGYQIVDLGSTNGTYLNDQRLVPRTPQLLKNGDTIRIGDTNFQYEISSPEVAPTVVADPVPVSPVDPAYLPTVAAPPPSLYNEQPQNRQGNYPTPPPPQNYGAPIPPQNYGAPTPLPQPYAPTPAYGQSFVPPVPGVPNYGAPPQKKSRRGLWITLGVVGVLLVLVCGACGFLTLLGGSSPDKVMETFCNDLQNGDYHDAYAQFSPAITAQASEAQFTQLFSTDKVSSCTYNPTTTSGSTATTNMSLKRVSGSSSNTGVVLIKNSNGDWKINSFQQQQSQ